jgi:hypothetical protein
MRHFALLGSLLLACGGSGHLVLALEHKPPLREDLPPAGVTRPVYAVTLDDERGDDENFLCNVGGDVLSERPIAQVVREAVEAELRVRDFRLAPPEEADVVIHITLHDVGCSVGRKTGAVGLRAKVDSEVGLLLMPGKREVYWTTVNHTGFAVPPADRNTKPDAVYRRAFQEALDGYARHVATHPDLMIEIQQLQARGELPE